MGKGVVIRIVRFLVQAPPGAWLHLGTHPCYKAPGDLRVEIEKNEQWTNCGIKLSVFCDYSAFVILFDL